MGAQPVNQTGEGSGCCDSLERKLYFEAGWGCLQQGRASR